MSARIRTPKGWERLKTGDRILRNVYWIESTGGQPCQAISGQGKTITRQDPNCGYRPPIVFIRRIKRRAKK